MKRYSILVLLLTLALTALACNIGKPSTEEQATPTQVPAASSASGQETTAETTAAETTTAEQPASSGAEPSSDATPGTQLSGAAGWVASPEEALDSYRMKTTMRPVEGQGGMLGDAEQIIEIAWVRDPEARHTKMTDSSGQVTLEMITIGATTWISMGDGSWIQSPAAAGGQGMDPQAFAPDMETILNQVEAGMELDGEEKVNGVNCQRYNVDFEFTYPMPTPEDAVPEMLELMPSEVEGHITGQMWIADERGLPEVNVRSRTTQELTLKYPSGREETMVYEEERDLFDINQPITIEPPEGATALPMPPTTEPGAGGAPAEGTPVESVPYASLEELDTYRLEMALTMQMAETDPIVTGYELEWVGDPLAWHLTMNIAGMVLGEYIMVDGTTWGKVGGTWMQATEDMSAEGFSAIEGLLEPEDDMILVGEETVNGILCQHYVYDFAAGGITDHHELWIANQPDLPPVVVRAIQQMDTGGVATYGEANLYEINQPITIESPQ